MGERPFHCVDKESKTIHMTCSAAGVGQTHTETPCRLPVRDTTFLVWELIGKGYLGLNIML